MKLLNSTAKGFAIVSAIFILVVLAVLGAFIVNVSTNQHIGSALDVQGVRAYQAARAGIEWGLYQQLHNNNCSAASNLPLAAPTLTTFTVTVTCVASVDANGGPTVYTITSTACSLPDSTSLGCPNTSPGNSYIERRLDVTF
jgi:MSHA biogenesis protein MshP